MDENFNEDIDENGFEHDSRNGTIDFLVNASTDKKRLEKTNIYEVEDFKYLLD